MIVELSVCLAHTMFITSSCGIFVYKLDTSIHTKTVCLSIFVFYMKFMKLVVSLIKDCCFCAIACNSVSTNEDILSVGPSQPEIIGLPTGLAL